MCSSDVILPQCTACNILYIFVYAYLYISCLTASLYLQVGDELMGAVADEAIAGEALGDEAEGGAEVSNASDAPIKHWIPTQCCGTPTPVTTSYMFCDS
jgi:hypothetical protein